MNEIAGSNCGIPTDRDCNGEPSFGPVEPATLAVPRGPRSRPARRRPRCVRPHARGWDLILERRPGRRAPRAERVSRPRRTSSDVTSATRRCDPLSLNGKFVPLDARPRRKRVSRRETCGDFLAASPCGKRSRQAIPGSSLAPGGSTRHPPRRVVRDTSTRSLASRRFVRRRVPLSLGERSDAGHRRWAACCFLFGHPTPVRPVLHARSGSRLGLARR